jgi:hypothetical protein
MTTPEINAERIAPAAQPTIQANGSNFDSIVNQVGPTGFSPAGAAEYTKATQGYLIALEQASRAVAKAKKSDSVSESHVQIAVGSLGGDHNSRFRHIGQAGSLLIGSGLGYFAMVIYGSSYTFKNSVIIFLPLLFGFILYAYSWGRG